MENSFSDQKWFLESIMEKVPSSVIVTGLDFKIIYVNREAEILFGYKRGEMIGKNPLIFNAEPGAYEIQKDIERIVNNGGKWQNRILNHKKNGDLFVVDCSVTPFEHNGKIIGFIGFQKDITEIELVKKDIEFFDSKYKILFNTSPFYINLVNSEGIIIDSNDTCENILGYNREELIGKHYSKIVHPDYIEVAIAEMEILSKSISSDITSTDYKMIKKNGSVIDVQATTTSFSDRDGNFTNTICFIIDISERKQIEMSLRGTAEELKKSNFELEQFAYVASHDLQEPMRVIASYCQLIKEKNYLDIDDDGKKYVDYVLSSAIRMKTLIKELLDFSRVGRKDNPFEYVDMNDIIKESISDYQMVINENKAVVTVEDLPNIFGISFRMKQLFSNLISNSLKFKSDKTPVIDIGCCDEGSYWLFYVKDNGLGIDPKCFDRVFGIFKRLYSRDEYPGTGIGLALCKRIVETHGGKIWVDSDVGEGTIMYFTIAKHIDFIGIIDNPLVS